MRAVVLPRAGDVRRAALLRRPCEGRGRLHFGFVVLGSPSVISGYVWELLAKQQLPIRRNRLVDEHISMRGGDVGSCSVARSMWLLAIKRRARRCCAVEGANSGGVFAMCRRVALGRVLSLPFCSFAHRNEL